MDDYSISTLSESKNEWCARLVNILTPCIIDGFRSIFNEAWKLCKENNEVDKYLITFQTFLSRIPKWNSSIIEEETNRIVNVSQCNYLEDLISCVHIIHLKAMSCIRVGQKQKKVDIEIPSLTDFIHKIYINIARKIYTNVYLFQKNIAPLDIQKYNRELEIIVKESILNTIRDSIPTETLLRAYMSETIEDVVDVREDIVEEHNNNIDNIDNTKNDNDYDKNNEVNKTNKTNEDLENTNNNVASDNNKPNDDLVIDITTTEENKEDTKKSINFNKENEDKMIEKQEDKEKNKDINLEIENSENIVINKTNEIDKDNESLNSNISSGTNTPLDPQSPRISFSNISTALENGIEKKVETNFLPSLDFDTDDEDDSIKIGEDIKLDIEDINSIDNNTKTNNDENSLDIDLGIETLE